MKNLFRIILAGTLFAGFAGALWGDIGFSGGSTGSGSGDIEGVLAGGGLAGGGTSGTPTLTVASTMSITGGQFDVGRSTLAVSLGKVGIGKSNPSYSLDVNGDMAVRDAFRVGLSTFYVTSSGNGIVGIGNTSPLLSLDISHGVSGSAGISIQNLTASGNSQIKLLDNSGNNVFDLAYGNGTSATHPEELYLTIPKGKLGIGTTTPSYWMHISTAAGESGTIFAVSTGSVDLFRVLGTSVNLKVPLVFPDGTVQVTAPSVSGAADNLGNHVATTTLNMATNAILGITSGTFSGDVTVYGSIKGGSGAAVLSSTPSIAFYANTGRYEMNLSTFVIPGSIGTSTNPNLLLFGSTVTTFSTPVKSTGNVRASNIGLAQWIIHLSSDTLAAGCTYFMGEAPSDTSITILKTRAKTYSVAASSANYGLQEKTDTNVNGTWLHTGTYSTATWAGGTPVTSFADNSVAAGNGVYLVTKDGGATAGTPRGLTVIVDFKYDNP